MKKKSKFERKFKIIICLSLIGTLLSESIFNASIKSIEAENVRLSEEIEKQNKENIGYEAQIDELSKKTLEVAKELGLSYNSDNIKNIENENN